MIQDKVHELKEALAYKKMDRFANPKLCLNCSEEFLSIIANIYVHILKTYNLDLSFATLC